MNDGKSPSHALSLDAFDFESIVLPVTYNPFDKIENTNDETVAKLRKVLKAILRNELTPKRRKIVLLRWKGMTVSEIANKLHIPKSTVCKQYDTGITRLKQVANYIKPFIKYKGV